jgi:hypothetical protein
MGTYEKEKSNEKKIPVTNTDEVQGRDAKPKERRSTRKSTITSRDTASQRLSTMETVS